MDIPFDTITKSARDTQELGEAFGHALIAIKAHPLTSGGGAQVVCLWGELGGGKTTFVQGMATGFGIASRLLSPTFIIVRHYKIPKSERVVYHLDLYRIEGAGSLNAVGFADMSNEPHAIVIVEWPERLGDALPKKRIDIRFEIISETERKITGSIHE